MSGIGPSLAQGQNHWEPIENNFYYMNNSLQAEHASHFTKAGGPILIIDL